jgi:hypothetical protein
MKLKINNEMENLICDIEHEKLASYAVEDHLACMQSGFSLIRNDLAAFARAFYLYQMSCNGYEEN